MIDWHLWMKIDVGWRIAKLIRVWELDWDGFDRLLVFLMENMRFLDGEGGAGCFFVVFNFLLKAGGFRLIDF